MSAPHWQTTISERDGIVCTSVPQPSRESAMAEAERIARTRQWGGRALAQDAEVVVELWDTEACRALERILLRADAAGNVAAIAPAPEPPMPARETSPTLVALIAALRALRERRSEDSRDDWRDVIEPLECLDALLSWGPEEITARMGLAARMAAEEDADAAATLDRAWAALVRLRKAILAAEG